MHEALPTWWLAATFLQDGLRHLCEQQQQEQQQNTECVQRLGNQREQRKAIWGKCCRSLWNSLSSPWRPREDGRQGESGLLHCLALAGPQQHLQSLGRTQSFSGGSGERPPPPSSAHKYLSHPSHFRSRAPHHLPVIKRWLQAQTFWLGTSVP